jgi:hypothetical protein
VETPFGPAPVDGDVLLASVAARPAGEDVRTEFRQGGPMRDLLSDYGRSA